MRLIADGHPSFLELVSLGFLTVVCVEPEVAVIGTAGVDASLTLVVASLG